MNQQPEALRLADLIYEKPDSDGHCIEAAKELRRLHAENESLKAELQEQARVNGTGGERELKLMAENDALRKDAAEVERRTIEKCVAVIQSYQIPYGNSAAGEIAAEMTLSMLREVRDEIRALANQQEKQQ